MLSKVSFMVERKNPSAWGQSLCSLSALQDQGEGDAADLGALSSAHDSDLRQFWSCCSSFMGALQVSPFLTDFYLQIFPHPFCNLTNCSRAVKMEQVKVGFKRGVLQLQCAGLNIHFR